MQKIDTIEIKNFKSIRHQKIEGCKRVNVFIGYPNVGKSNILEALSLFSIEEKNLDFSAFVRIENLTTLFYNGEIGKQSEIRLNDKHRFVVRLENENLLFQQQLERDGTSFEKEDTRKIFLDDSADVSVKRTFQLRESDKSILNNKSSGIGRENTLRDVKKYEFLKKVIHSKQGYSSLSYPYGENIFNVISAHPNLLQEITELFKQYNLELLYESREQKFTILKRTSLGIFSIPYELVADTLQRVVFFKCAIKTNVESILLFEEPEAHMFPPYISKLSGDIMYDENDNQFFITTHSPFVLNDLMDNLKSDELAIYIVSYKKETGETIINKMGEEDVHDAYQFGYDFFMNIDKFISQKQHDEF